VKALIKTSDDIGYDLAVLKAVEAVNERQKSVLFAKAMKYFDGNLKGKTFAMWGLAFKPKTDDMREAPSIRIIKGLIAAGARVIAYDPVATETAKKRLESWMDSLMEKITTAFVKTLMGCWWLLNGINSVIQIFTLIKSKMRRPVIF